MVSADKTRPLVLGDVDGEEKGLVGDKGEEGTPLSDDGPPLSDEELLEPEGGLGLLLPWKREGSPLGEGEEPSLGEGELVEGGGLSPVVFGLCSNAGEG